MKIQFLLVNLVAMGKGNLLNNKSLGKEFLKKYFNCNIITKNHMISIVFEVKYKRTLDI